MGLWPLTKEQRRVQNELIFGLALLLSLLVAALTLGVEFQRMLFGKATQAYVVHVTDPGDYKNRRITSARVDYEYFDDAASVGRRDIYYTGTGNDPWPKVGQTLDVEYIPGWNLSWPITGESRLSQFWPVTPALVLGGCFAVWAYTATAPARRRNQMATNSL